MNLSQAIPILFLIYFSKLSQSDVSCLKYVCSGTYSRVSSFSLTSISALFVISLIIFVSICTPSSLLSFVCLFCIYRGFPYKMATQTIFRESEVGQFLPWILGLNLLLHFSFQSIFSSEQMNSFGEIGSPCLIPLSSVKFSPSESVFLFLSSCYCRYSSLF